MITIKAGGEAGQGVESSSAGFAKSLMRSGFHVFVLLDYHSRIRGGHNFAQIRVSETPLWSHSEPVHILLALDEESIPKHLGEVVPGGAVIYDEGRKVDHGAIEARGVHPVPAPILRIAKEVGGSDVMANTAAFAIAAGLLGLPMEPLEGIIQENFRKKGPAVVESNLRVSRAAYDWARTNYSRLITFRLTPRAAPGRMLMNGNEAFALGALLGGCKFVAGYPMTPGSPVLEWMAAHASRYGVVAMQVEDEIAALNMAVGAAYAGVRAMTTTSGGGFSLMVEALGLAGMTETPVVIYEAQRPGPSTGMATRTEQGDLHFVLHASQGEFPRIVLAPGTIEQAFEAGWRAFNLAERYQCPVIVLSDHFLATSLRDVPQESLGMDKVLIDRGKLLSEHELDALAEGEYKRFAFTEDGISPRAVPGHPKAVYPVMSDEHDETGHITEDPVNRRLMMEKRMRKLTAALKEMRPPSVYGPEEAEITLVGWGSTYGPLREAVERLNGQGIRANMVHIVDIWPFPAEAVAGILSRARRLVAVESNYSGQMADLIRMKTGIEIKERILKYDGRALSPEFILRELGV